VGWANLGAVGTYAHGDAAAHHRRPGILRHVSTKRLRSGASVEAGAERRCAMSGTLNHELA
jgi:hypothetical protein